VVFCDIQENGVAANMVNFNNVILAQARSKSALAFNQMERLLRKMEEQYSAGDEMVKPIIVTHSNVI
jgi:hypothetical protein